MSGLLPQGCKTVNEAAAWAIDETQFDLICAAQENLDTQDQEGVFLANEVCYAADRQQALFQWLALRNDRRIAAMSKELNKHYDFFDQLPTSYDDLFPEDEDD